MYTCRKHFWDYGCRFRNRPHYTALVMKTNTIERNGRKRVEEGVEKVKIVSIYYMKRFDSTQHESRVNGAQSIVDVGNDR